MTRWRPPPRRSRLNMRTMSITSLPLRDSFRSRLPFAGSACYTSAATLAYRIQTPVTRWRPPLRSSRLNMRTMSITLLTP